jgi:ADP-ribosylglycohydrolase
MGGPVEFWHHKKIIEKFGKVDTLMPYDRQPNPHGPWKTAAGTYTDDTRLNKLFCKAVLDKKGVPTDKDLARAIISYYHSAPEGLEKEWIEEYYFKAVYREDKNVFGGQPTNGGIMAIAPFGVINPCDPLKALTDAYDALFMVEGYSRYSAAIAASAISSAMKPDSTVDSIINDSLKAVKVHKSKVEGALWPATELYHHVGQKNEQLINKGLEIAKKYGDPYTLRDELLANIQQQFGPDGSESLAIAMTMFYAAKGDYVESIKGAVNCGRDNDSSASVAGAISGALNGVDKIPSEWVELVEKANPGPTFREIAESFCNIITAKYEQDRRVLGNIQQLI